MQISYNSGKGLSKCTYTHTHIYIDPVHASSRSFGHIMTIFTLIRHGHHRLVLRPKPILTQYLMDSQLCIHFVIYSWLPFLWVTSSSSAASSTVILSPFSAHYCDRSKLRTCGEYCPQSPTLCSIIRKAIHVGHISFPSLVACKHQDVRVSLRVKTDNLTRFTNRLSSIFLWCLQTRSHS